MLNNKLTSNEQIMSFATLLVLTVVVYFNC